MPFAQLPDNHTGALFRSTDWSRTALGPVERWPQSLCTAVGICLNSRFPMFVWWGSELVNIYNDAYIPVLGKRHPAAFGRPAQSIWGEIWPVVGPQAEAVMQRGEATWNERVLLVMERHGYTEDTWFTWSYSAIPDEKGGIGGVFCACTEDTPRVLVERERDRLLGEIELERRRLSEAFAQSPAFLAMLRGPQHVFDFVNERYYQLIGRRDVIGKTVREALPEVEGQGFFEILDRVYATGEPFVGTAMRVGVRRHADLAVEDAYLDFVYQPVLAPGGAVTGILVHGVDVTDQKRNEARDRFLVALDDAVRPLMDPTQITATCGRLLGEHLKVDRCSYADVGEDQGASDTEVHGVCVPLHKGGRRVAAMAVHQKTPRRWRPEDVELARTVAGRCWESIERARVARTLRESEARFRQLADAMPQIVFAATPEGHVDYFNRQWYEYTGLPDGAIDPDAWTAVFTPQGLQRALECWRAAVRTGNQFEAEYSLRRHDGESRWHLGRAVPIRDDAGRIVRWFGTNTDIHERKQFEQSLQEARAEAERASRMKDEFLATLSHELRTPLNAILGWAEILRLKAALPEDLAGGVGVIERNARAQGRIIEDLLDMSAIISGKVRLDLHRVDLGEVVRSAVDTARPTAAAKRIQIHVRISPAVASTSGDAHRLQQVLWNLLSNAIKFTPNEGRIDVALAQAAGHFEIRVADTGRGIEPQFLPFLFDRFRQADASKTRRYSGLGLGLSIVKQLVELHGGSVRAESLGPGVGAVFTFTLPRVAPRPDAPAIIAAPVADGAEIAGLRVLVVDDDADARDLLKRLLEDRSASVTTASSAAEAAGLVQAQRFDVLVSDIGMPEEDGYALMRRVRAMGSERGGNIPAIALSAYAQAEDRVQAVRAGFQMHLAKPVEPAELLAMVASLARRL